MNWLWNLFPSSEGSYENEILSVNGKDCVKVLAENIVVGSMLSNGKRVSGLKEANITLEGSPNTTVVSLGCYVYVVKE